MNAAQEEIIGKAIMADAKAINRRFREIKEPPASHKASGPRRTLPKRIVEYLTDHPGATVNDVAGGLGTNRRNARNRLAQMAGDGRLTRWKDSDGFHEPYRYEVAT